jgi:hypothetical protein
LGGWGGINQFGKRSCQREVAHSAYVTAGANVNADDFTPLSGVCQNQNPTNISSIYSQQQRIAGNLQTGGGQVKARQINGDWGVVDFVETPEGAGCGIIKPHTLFAKSSIHTAPANSLTSLLFNRHPIIPMKQIAADIVQLWADYQAGVNAALAAAPPGGIANELPLLPPRRVMVMSNGQPLGMLDHQHVQELTDDLRKVGGTCACALASACPISPFHPASQFIGCSSSPDT